MRSVFLICICIGLTGCERSYWITQREPFKSYVGRDLTLKRPAFLWKEQAVVTFGDAFVLTDTNRPAYQDSDVRLGLVRRVTDLPSGTRVRVESVQRVWDFESGAWFYAYGRIDLPGEKKSVRYSYNWGDYNRIYRAPWDEDDVPSERYVGEDGKSFLSK